MQQYSAAKLGGKELLFSDRQLQISNRVDYGCSKF